jgi:hypothetical protein
MPTYKNKEKGTWYCAFYYTDWTGKKKKKKKEGFNREKDAKEYERQFLEESQVSPDMKFSTIVKIYMEDCKTRMKLTSYVSKEYIVNLKCIPFFGDMPINSIEPSMIRKWQNKLIEENNYSLPYLKSLNNQLSSIFNFAMKYYKLGCESGDMTALHQLAKLYIQNDDIDS